MSAVPGTETATPDRRHVFVHITTTPHRESLPWNSPAARPTAEAGVRPVRWRQTLSTRSGSPARSATRSVYSTLNHS